MTLVLSCYRGRGKEGVKGGEEGEGGR